MRTYRVCHKVEALAQSPGMPWQAPNSAQWLQSTLPGFHVTGAPEYWRRILNRQCADNGQAQRYLYTLLLDIPDDTPLTAGPLPGYEYTLASGTDATVIAVAGPEWPLPPWVPQPSNENEWNPSSTRWTAASAHWVGRNGE